MKRGVLAALIAFLVVTAGCVGAMGAATPGGTDAGGVGETAHAESGTVNFYVSDRPDDVDDFAHLNVTVTSVRFHLADDGSADGDADDAGNATGTGATATAAVNGTATGAATATEPANGTPAETADDTDSPTATTEATDEETEAEDVKAEEEGGESDGRWVERDVNATTVDLTRLRGANATLLGAFDVPAGEYDAVFLSVSGTNGTLTTGKSTNVKLPSEKLQLHTDFTVENGSTVDFVYDVTVHEAGNSGTYVLQPVVAESGTDMPIERVDDGDGDERSLRASFVGNVTAGENVTVRVTENGSALANATVSVGDGPAGTTDADGEYAVDVPDDAEELEVEVEHGDAEAELEAEFDDADSDADEADGDGNDTDDAAGDSGDGVADRPEAGSGTGGANE